MSCEDISCAISVVELTASLEDTGICSWGSISGEVTDQEDLKTDIVFDYISANTSYEETGSEPVGAIFWNADDEIITAKVNENVSLDLSQEIHYPVINQTGATISNGTPVMFAGTVGNSGKLKIQKAIADGSFPAVYMMGVATEGIANGATGKVTHFGKVRGINTTGAPYGETWNDGDLIYVDPDTAGNLTKTAPNAPDLQILVAAVVKAHSNGTLFVRPSWHCKFQDLDDVNGGTLDKSGQFYVWDQSNSYFEPTQNITITDASYQINSTDDLNISCDTAKTLKISPVVYDDQQVNIFQVGKGASAPTEQDYKCGKVLSFANGQNNQIYFNIQYSHRIATGQSTEFHVHTIAPDDNAGGVRWTLTVSYANINSDHPAESSISSTQTIEAGSQDKHVVFEIADPFVNADSGISGIAICSLTRNGSDVADTYGNAIYVSALDSHFPIDTIGSRQEYAK